MNLHLRKSVDSQRQVTVLHTESNTYKSAGVVVPQRLGVAKGLKQRVGLQNDVFDVLRDRCNELLVTSQADRRRRSNKCSHSHRQMLMCRSLELSTQI